MLKPMIEFCASNMHHGTDRLMKKLEANPDFDVIEYGCLGNCGECYMVPFGMVDGTIIAAETVDELEQEIMKAIEKQKAEREALDRLIDDM
ncbi:YuzB family protein [Paenibacillus sp. OV219]|uniref:YuzB family protein n=1 Tax=Paenibacillus sp. OV219 TaxID=1884377 RepID=UPI000B8339D3|nr:YuzB family protein [Paenibacillus sp. OV219]